MTMSQRSAVTLSMPDSVLWLLRLGITALGFVLGLLVKPLFNWITDLAGGAPGPLRLAAALPTGWAIAVLTLAGAVAGWWVARAARKESLLLTVDGESVRLSQDGADRYLAREDVGEVFRDGKELVLLGKGTKPLARHDASDLKAAAVQTAFERFGYPWRGPADPHEGEFRRWVDGHPDLDEQLNQLMRARARALADKQPGTAAHLADELAASGIVVRDRKGSQQYRHLPA